jgi:hypothetical protein
MKPIMLKLIMLLVLAIPGWTHGQHLDSLPIVKRDSILLKIAKETVMKYGPGYYRDHQPPMIKRLIMSEQGTKDGKGNTGRIYYSVTYPEDATVEQCELNAAAIVNIWADTDSAFRVFFGCGYMYSELERLEREGIIIKPVPYWKELTIHYRDSVRQANPWPKQ